MVHRNSQRTRGKAICAGLAALVFAVALGSCREQPATKSVEQRDEIRLSASFGLVCTFQPVDGKVDCPRGDLDGFEDQSSLRSLSFDVGSKIKDLEAGPGVACYLGPDGHADCVGSSSWPDVSKATRRFRFTDIDIGVASLICLAKEGGDVLCSSQRQGEAVTVETAQELSQITVGGDHICGIEKSMQLAKCWNLSSRALDKLVPAIDPVGDFGQFDPPPKIRFAQLAAGNAHTCGLTVDGELMCWGADKTASPDGPKRDVDYGQTHPPKGKFASVTSGHGHSCALRHDGPVECWGRDDYGQASPPKVRFAAVDAAGLSTCGITVNGDLRCWGKAKQ